MARSFASASSQQVTTGIGSLGFAFGPGTIVAVVRRTNTGVAQVAFAAGIAGTTCYNLQVTAADVVALKSDALTAAGVTTLTSGRYYLIAATKATGLVAPRLHVFDYSTGLWKHENSGTTLANSSVPATSARLGASETGASFWNGEQEIAAVWNSVLTDAQIESLPFWITPWLVPLPRALWLFEMPVSIPLIDLVGSPRANQTSIVGTTFQAWPYTSMALRFDPGVPPRLGVGG